MRDEREVKNDIEMIDEKINNDIIKFELQEISDLQEQRDKLQKELEEIKKQKELNGNEETLEQEELNKNKNENDIKKQNEGQNSNQEEVNDSKEDEIVIENSDDKFENNASLMFENIDIIMGEVSAKVLEAENEYKKIAELIENANTMYATDTVVDNKIQNKTIKSFLEENIANFDGANYNYTTDEAAIEFVHKQYSDRKAKINQVGGSPEIKAIDNSIGIFNVQKDKINDYIKTNNLSEEEVSLKKKEIKNIEEKIKELNKKIKEQRSIEKEFLIKESKFRKILSEIRRRKIAKFEYIRKKILEVYEKLKATHENLLEKIKLLEQELEKLIKEKENLEKEKEEIEKQIEKIKTEIENKDSKIDELSLKLNYKNLSDDEKEKINKEIEQLTNEKGELEGSLLDLSQKQSEIDTRISDLKIDEKEKIITEMKDEEKNIASKVEEYRIEFEKYGLKSEELRKEFDVKTTKTDGEVEQEISDEAKPKKETPEVKKDTAKKETNSKSQGNSNGGQMSGNNAFQNKGENSLTLLDKNAGAKGIIEKYISLDDHADRRAVLDSQYSAIMNALKYIKPSELNDEQKKKLKYHIDDDKNDITNEIKFSENEVRSEINDLFSKYGNIKGSPEVIQNTLKFLYEDLYSITKNGTPNILNDLRKSNLYSINFLNDTIKNFYELVNNGKIQDEKEIENFEKYISNIAKQGLISTSSKKLTGGLMDKFSAKFSTKNPAVDNLYSTVKVKEQAYMAKKTSMKDELASKTEPNPRTYSDRDVDDITRNLEKENSRILGK